jgi:hypothetical protein
MASQRGQKCLPHRYPRGRRMRGDWRIAGFPWAIRGEARDGLAAARAPPH